MQSCGTDWLKEACIKVVDEIHDHAHIWATSIRQIVILKSHKSALLTQNSELMNDQHSQPVNFLAWDNRKIAKYTNQNRVNDSEITISTNELRLFFTNYNRGYTTIAVL